MDVALKRFLAFVKRHHEFLIHVVADRFLRLLNAIDIEDLVAVHHLVARDPDDTLDEVGARLHRVIKHDHVARLRLRPFGELGIEHREPDTVLVLIYGDEVTGLKRREH